jgi:hypothetical protein
MQPLASTRACVQGMTSGPLINNSAYDRHANNMLDTAVCRRLQSKGRWCATFPASSGLKLHCQTPQCAALACCMVIGGVRERLSGVLMSTTRKGNRQMTMYMLDAEC